MAAIFTRRRGFSPLLLLSFDQSLNRRVLVHARGCLRLSNPPTSHDRWNAPPSLCGGFGITATPTHPLCNGFPRAAPDPPPRRATEPVRQAFTAPYLIAVAKARGIHPRVALTLEPPRSGGGMVI